MNKNVDGQRMETWRKREWKRGGRENGNVEEERMETWNKNAGCCLDQS